MLEDETADEESALAARRAVKASRSGNLSARARTRTVTPPARRGSLSARATTTSSTKKAAPRPVASPAATPPSVGLPDDGTPVLSPQYSSTTRPPPVTLPMAAASSVTAAADSGELARLRAELQLERDARKRESADHAHTEARLAADADSAKRERDAAEAQNATELQRLRRMLAEAQQRAREAAEAAEQRRAADVTRAEAEAAARASHPESELAAELRRTQADLAAAKVRIDERAEVVQAEAAWRTTELTRQRDRLQAELSAALAAAAEAEAATRAMRGALLVADGELGSLHEAAEHASAIGGREAAALRVQLVELDRQRVAEAAAERRRCAEQVAADRDAFDANLARMRDTAAAVQVTRRHCHHHHHCFLHHCHTHIIHRPFTGAAPARARLGDRGAPRQSAAAARRARRQRGRRLA